MTEAFAGQSNGLCGPAYRVDCSCSPRYTPRTGTVHRRVARRRTAGVASADWEEVVEVFHTAAAAGGTAGPLDGRTVVATGPAPKRAAGGILSRAALRVWSGAVAEAHGLDVDELAADALLAILAGQRQDVPRPDTVIRQTTTDAARQRHDRARRLPPLANPGATSRGGQPGPA